MDLPKRKPNRSPHIDYNRSGAYFLTLCVQDRRPILSAIDDMGNIVLSEYGLAVEHQIQECNRYYENLRIEQYCIMPDHVHMITVNPSVGQGGGRANDRIPAFVSSFKRFTNKQIGFPIWQRSYYDSVLQDTREYQNAVEYMLDNPKNWLTEHTPFSFRKTKSASTE